MSELDNENVKQEEHQPLVNYSNQENSQNNNEAQRKKKKKILFGVVGFLILIGVILAIVLPLTLKKKDDGNGEDPFAS